MDKTISVIIPNRNGGVTIGKCLESVYSSIFDNFEVIVVDDCSDDNSIETIKSFPCRLIVLEKHSGAAKARNIGAFNSNGDILFFTDADCLLKENTLSIAAGIIMQKGPGIIAGGTYTREPYDKGFFSLFQSVFINYSETKKADNPDYVATHAMAISAETFRESSGFSVDSLPVLEDVEFSHRLRRKGYRLIINSDMLVKHIFNYSLAGSIRNAVRKSMHWTVYSLKNRDLFADSGTASIELKVNVISYVLMILSLTLWIFSRKSLFLYSSVLIPAFNIFINRRLFHAFYETKGMFFALLASIYYTLIYPLAVGTGVLSGVMKYLLR